MGVCFCKFLRDYAKDGDVFWVIAQSFPTLKDVPLKILYQLLPAAMFPKNKQTYDPTIHEIPALKLKLPGNRGIAEVWFKSEDQGIGKFESSRLRGIWWTECESEALYHALQPRLLARGGFMLMDYVPYMGWHRIELREKSTNKESAIWWKRFVIMDNEHNLGPGVISKLKARLSKQEWEIRGLGKEAAMIGVVYPNFDPVRHCIQPFKIPDTWPIYSAGDWGFRAPHCFALATISPNGTVYVIAEDYQADQSVPQTVNSFWEMVNSIRPMQLYRGCTHSEDMFAQMRSIDFKRRNEDDLGYALDYTETQGNPIREHVMAEFHRVLAGACAVDDQIFQNHGGSMTLASEFWRGGLPVKKATKRSIDMGVESVRRLFDSGKLFFFDTCRSIRQDHVSWRFKEGKDRAILPADKYEGNYSHGCDCVRYMLQQHMTYEWHGLEESHTRQHTWEPAELS